MQASTFVPLIKAIFPGHIGRVKGNDFYVNVSELNNDHIFGLHKLDEFCLVRVKRSGTGLVIIITPKVKN
jgi:hypothetical protein